ncbi:hypothetical protein [Halobaculum magnesiiphilum]|uniref:Uncharacterized protein n=1 Tax=Halobaculum magnesiiphilum TaxID=1017351 RepID=A0A8T8WEN0_9EURY|nr:hypothetical protein [Halobaculum magnesiiphilum]QZP38246.1 hypothetical protein K6T50_03565 [Halobaculum magnesiiphilum]
MIVSLTGLTLCLWIVQSITDRISPSLLDTDQWGTSRSYGLAILFCATAFIHYMIYIKQFKGYYGRITTILNLDRGTAQQVVSESTHPPTIEVLGYTPPAVLSWATPLLVLAIISGIAALIIVSKSIRGEDQILPLQYSAVAVSIVGVYGVAYLIGGRAAGIRLLPQVTVVAAPLVSIIFVSLLRRRGLPLVYGLVGILLIAGIFTPAVSIPERTAGDYRPTASHSDLANVEWTTRHADHFMSDTFLVQVAHWKRLSTGTQSSEPEGIIGLRQSDPESVEMYLHPEDSSLLIHRAYFTRYYGVQRPHSANLVYTNGETTVHNL